MENLVQLFERKNPSFLPGGKSIFYLCLLRVVFQVLGAFFQPDALVFKLNFGPVVFFVGLA